MTWWDRINSCHKSAESLGTNGLRSRLKKLHLYRFYFNLRLAQIESRATKWCKGCAWVAGRCA